MLRPGGVRSWPRERLGWGMKGTACAKALEGGKRWGRGKGTRLGVEGVC